MICCKWKKQLKTILLCLGFLFAMSFCGPAPAEQFDEAESSIFAEIQGEQDGNLPSWKQVYRDFVLEKQYAATRDPLDPGIYADKFGNCYDLRGSGIIAFGLYDWNMDGIPELFARNGAPEEERPEAFIYTWRNGHLACLGCLAGCNGGPWVTVNTKYPGVLSMSGNRNLHRMKYTLLQEDGPHTGFQVYDEKDSIATAWASAGDLFAEIRDKGIIPICRYPVDSLGEENWTDFILESGDGHSQPIPVLLIDDQAATVAESFGDWKAAYHQYLVGQEFKTQAHETNEWDGQVHYTDRFGQDYYYGPDNEYSGTDCTIRFALYDWNQDGVPELFSYCGARGKTGGQYYAYTFLNGRMECLGTVGNGIWFGLMPYRDGNYNVLFTETADTFYYDINCASWDGTGTASMEALASFAEWGEEVEDGEREYFTAPTDEKLFGIYNTAFRDNGSSERIYGKDLTFSWISDGMNTDEAWWNDFIVHYLNEYPGASAGEAAATPDEPGSSTETAYATGTTVKDGVNLREKSSKKSNLLVSLKKGQQVEILGEETGGDNKLWYRCRYDGKTGYIRNDMLKVTVISLPEKKDDPEGSYLSWKQLYQNFILGDQYKVQRESPGSEIYIDIFGNYYDINEYKDVMFGLYDWNGDGIPELFADNGSLDTGWSETIIYTCSDGVLICLGTLVNRAGGPWITADAAYPGVLTKNGNMGYFVMEYTVPKGTDSLTSNTVYIEDYNDPNAEDGILESPNITVDAFDAGLYTSIRNQGLILLCKTEARSLNEANWDDFIASAIIDRSHPDVKWSVPWSSYMELPTEQEMANHIANERGPYIVGVPSFKGSGKYTDYAVDFRADHLPAGTYLCTCQFDLDTSPLLKQYASVSRDYRGVAGYSGFQKDKNGKGYAILTVWDTYCTDKNGEKTTIRAKAISSSDGNFEHLEDATSGEGDFVHVLVPYDWQEGKNYRTAIQIRGSRLIFKVQDLESSIWTQLAEYDLGYEGTSFKSPCTFLEDFSRNTQGYLRSMVLSNFRVRDSLDGKWLSTKELTFRQDYNHNGSYNYGSEDNVFWAITTHIPGCCETPEQNKRCTVNSADNSAPY